MPNDQPPAGLPASPSALEADPAHDSPQPTRRTAESLRSARWFGPADLRSFGHRSRAMQMGYAPEEWTGKPIIAILNTWSDLQPCHSHFKTRVDDVKRGILMAGGFPVELPALSVSESYVKPTTMLYRNMLAMETRGAAALAPRGRRGADGRLRQDHAGPAAGRHQHEHPRDLPARGPDAARQLAGQGAGLAAATSWKYWDELRAGKITDQDWLGVEGGIARSYGTCMTMGTASTMTAIAEAMGMVLPGGSSIPAADAGHIRLASESGRRIVDMVWEDLTPQKIQTRAAFENAIAVAMAMGCSTNAIIHLIAMARRAGQEIGLDDFERYSRRVPVIGNVRPQRQPVPDGGLLLRRRHSRPDARDPRAPAPGLPHRQRPHAGREHRGRARLQRRRHPPDRQPDLRRGLAGRAARQPRAGRLRDQAGGDGPAVPQALRPGAGVRRLPEPQGSRSTTRRCDVTAEHVLVLRNAGPQGGPGMPEWGMLPMPKKLLKQGHRDMLRMSDARMSGTSYGACVLHVAPEAYIGGPLALLRTGDIVTLDVDARTIRMEVSDEELAARRAAWVPPEARFERGYGWVFTKHIQQANEGCDFDFLRTDYGAPVAEPVIY